MFDNPFNLARATFLGAILFLPNLSFADFDREAEGADEDPRCQSLRETIEQAQDDLDEATMNEDPMETKRDQEELNQLIEQAEQEIENLQCP